jgi:hypothetical protein
VRQAGLVTVMTEQLLTHLLHTRTEFVTRHQQDHPEAQLGDALTAAFSAGVTAVLDAPSPNP